MWGTIIIIITAASYIRIQQIKDNYSGGACKGEVKLCRLRIAVAQSHMVKSRYDYLINNIHGAFIRTFDERMNEINNNPDTKKEDMITQLDRIDALNFHRAIMWYSFIPAIEESKRLLRENGIPTDAKKLEDYIEEKNNHVNAIVWSRYRDLFSQRILKFSLEERESSQVALLPTYKQFARELIMTGVSIAKDDKQ